MDKISCTKPCRSDVKHPPNKNDICIDFFSWISIFLVNKKWLDQPTTKPIPNRHLSYESIMTSLSRHKRKQQPRISWIDIGTLWVQGIFGFALADWLADPNVLYNKNTDSKRSQAWAKVPMTSVCIFINMDGCCFLWEI